MGWAGYGIYGGDDTQTRHIDFVKWAKIKMTEDEVWECMAANGTHLPDEALPLLTKNLDKILKKMPKLRNERFRDEDDALEWQMLLALFLDNRLNPPDKVYEMGVKATDYLMGQHADEFNEPSKRRKALRAFLKKAEKYCTSTRVPKFSYVTYDWKQGGCEEEYEVALKEFGLHMVEDPVMEGSDQYGYFITKKVPTKDELKAIVTEHYGKEFLDECGWEECCS